MVSTKKTLTSAIPKRRKLTLADVEAVAERVTKFRLNESQACYRLNINPKQWFQFKQRHKVQGQFEAMIDAIRAAQIENCVQVIDEHGDGVEYTALNKQGEVVTLTKPGDWRAKAWIAERVLSPEVFGDRQGSQTNVNVSIVPSNVLDSLLAKVYAEPAKVLGTQQQVIECEQVKQLPEPNKE